MAPRARYNRWILRLVVAVVALVLAETVLLVVSFLSPSAGDHIGRGARRVARVFIGTKTTRGLPGQVGRALAVAWDRAIVPLWFTPKVTAKPAFARCVSCHPDYASSKRFSATYMDHVAHAQRGIVCSTCHTDVEHPNPALPEEATCATCHGEVNDSKKCTLCHPPGSLPHFYLLGAPRDGAVDCNTCHPSQSFARVATKPLVTVPSFTGQNQALCLSCHEQSTCGRCHGTKHPSNWVRVHGKEADEDPGPCYACHTGNWCSDRCHAQSDLMRRLTQPARDESGGTP